MTKRDSAEYKIEKAGEMIVGALPPIDKHPGEFIRDVLLPEYGLKVAPTARMLGVDRSGFIGVLNGKYDVSRDLAYKLGALLRDEVADLLIAYQHAYDLQRERGKREAFKQEIDRLPSPVAVGGQAVHSRDDRGRMQLVDGGASGARSLPKAQKPAAK